MNDLETATHEIELISGKCRAYGLCVGLAPDHFDMPSGQPQVLVLKRTVAEDEFEEVEEAVDACPAQALRLLDRGES